MDIFKLGDKILALLEAVFGFWNNQISLVFAMLGQSPVSFKGGGPWAVIEGDRADLCSGRFIPRCAVLCYRFLLGKHRCKR